MEESLQVRRSMLLMVLCAVLWSIGGIFIKLLPWNAFVLSGLRSLLSAGVVLVYMRRARIPFVFSLRSVASGSALAVTLFLYVIATKLTSAANAIVLQYTAPLYVLVFSFVFLHEKPLRMDLIAALITLAGIALFFFDQLTPDGMLGNILAVFSGVALASMFVINGRIDEPTRMSGIFLGQSATAVIGLCLLPFFPPEFTAAYVLYIVILGVAQLGIPYVIYGIAAKHCPPLASSMIGLIEPLLNPVWVFIFAGERPGMFAFLGAAVVLITITVWALRKSQVQIKSAHKSPSNAAH
jgi:drug/metabolite transporter (DMT)-like permease